eukprot:TRINITY_DN76714_c0_g1_i1.p1 TRINITY_DN76714_c0_g1~~TRINITY_DN76714_c0_g1_i1.p1  ORF type:complete len:602 (-),score=69.70 TRINITY_DN76714_c0_g1_i1:234-2039(-)
MRAVQILRAASLSKDTRAPLCIDRRAEPEPCKPCWELGFDRILQWSSLPVCGLLFVPGTSWLIVALGSGDLKVWDTESWAEITTLKGRPGELPISVSCSMPDARGHWLVNAQSSGLCVFRCCPPWSIECCIPPCAEQANSPNSPVHVWCCASFSYVTSKLAAASTGHLVVLAYERGWGSAVSSRSHSLPPDTKPTGITFTSCGTWLALSNDLGQVQIWRAAHLILEKTLDAQHKMVHCLVSSPPRCGYKPRLVWGGASGSVQVWHSGTWKIESEVRDRDCLESGQEVHWCSFTQDGLWLVTISRTLCIWQVTWEYPVMQEVGGGLRNLCLILHQRLTDDDSAHGSLKVAAMNHGRQQKQSVHGSLVVGTSNGALSLWTQQNDSASAPNTVPEIDTKNTLLCKLKRAVSDTSFQRCSLSLASTADADASSSSEEEDEVTEPVTQKHMHSEPLQEKTVTPVIEKTVNGGRALLKPSASETILKDHCGGWQQQVTTRSLPRPASRGGNCTCSRDLRPSSGNKDRNVLTLPSPGMLLSHGEARRPGLEVAPTSPAANRRTSSNPPDADKKHQQKQQPSSGSRLALRRNSTALILGLASSGGHKTR